MADYADRVVTEIVADTSGYDPKIRTAAQTTTTAMTQIERSATRAEAAVRTSAQGISRSLDQTSQRARLMGFQIADVGQQLAGGQSPFLIIAQQAPQMANALEGGTSAAARLASFLSRPFGAALLAAGSIIGVILGKLVDFKSELEEATEKLEENARKAEINRQAQASFALTLTGVTEAIRTTQEALDQLAHSHDSAARRALVSALTNQNLLQTYVAQTDLIIQQTHAQIELNRARNQVAGNDPRITSTLNADNDASVERLRQIEQALISARQRIIETAGQVRDAISQVSVEQGSKSPEDRIHDRYNGLIEAARQRALAEHKVGNELFRQVQLYRDQERAEVEALQRREQAARRAASAPPDRSLTRPVTGGLIAPYGADRSGVPLHGRLIPGRRHEGLDFAGRLGDPVVAPEGGRALVRNDPGGLGLNVVITADSGARNILAHLSRANVSTGDRVAAGDLVGLIGNSGNAAGGVSHLHYQRIVNGRSVDPTRLFGASGAAQAAQAAETAAQRAAQQAAQQAERRQRDEDQFQSQLAGLNADILNARRRQVQTEEEAAAADRAAILAEQAERDQRIRADAAERIRRDASQAVNASVEAGILLARSAELAAIKTATSDAQHQQRLDEQRIEIAHRDLNDRQSVLQARGQLARTASERLEVELRLLDLQHQEEVLAIEKQRAQQGLTRDQIEQLDRAEAAANTRYSLAQQGAMRQYAGPLDQFLNAIPKGAAEMNEALQEVAVHGLTSLNDGLAQAATRFLHLGGVAGEILNQILSDLIRIGLQQAELAAFGGAQGGGGLFSFLGNALNIASSATGGGGGFDYGAFVKGAINLGGHANGYVGPIGGVGGIDRNVLSINGVPRARVSGSETLAIIPQGKALGFGGGMAARGGASQAPQRVEILVRSTGDFEAKVASIAGNLDVAMIREAGPQLIDGAKAATMRSLGRRPLNG